uniref:Uncharacterized protein n=1 Tax=Candidozyma auris TaxID=498019 RepID=A0A0L0P5B7_CANAR
MLRVGLFLTENVFLVIFEIEESEMEVDMSCFNLFFSALLAGPVCVWWIQMNILTFTMRSTNAEQIDFPNYFELILS